MAGVGGGEGLDQLRDQGACEGAAGDDGRELPPEASGQVPDEQVGQDVGDPDGEDRGQPDQGGQGGLEVKLEEVTELRLRPEAVDPVGGRRSHDHAHAHDKDPDQQGDLDVLVLGSSGQGVDGQQDEGDQGNAGHTVGLEAVRRGANGVTCVVADAVSDDTGVAGIVFLDLEDDLHEVGADVGNLGEDATRDAEGGGTQGLADGEADEAGAGSITGNEEQDREHQEQLDGDQQHADGHARLEGDLHGGVGLATQAGKGRAGVGKGVDADAEPGHSHGAQDADDREDEHHDHLPPAHGRVGEVLEVGDHDDRDEGPEERDELDLGDQVGLAGLIDQLGDLEHGLVHREVPDLGVLHEAEADAEQADDQPDQQQVVARHAQEAALQGRDLQVGLTGKSRARHR